MDKRRLTKRTTSMMKITIIRIIIHDQDAEEILPIVIINLEKKESAGVVEGGPIEIMTTGCSKTRTLTKTKTLLLQISTLYSLTSR